MTEEIKKTLTSIEQLLSKQGLLQKEVLSLKEVCEYLQVSPSYLYHLTYKNAIPHYVPTGKKIYFKRSELDSWLLQNRQDAKSEIESRASDYLIRRGRVV
jgi:excisionase family DNA binding protein